MCQIGLFGIVVVAGLFPFGEDFRLEFASANEFLEVADDGAAGDAELTGEGGDVGACFAVGDAAAYFGLAAEAICAAAEEEFGVNAFGSFESFEAFEDFGFAAFFEGSLDGFLEFAEVDRFVDGVVGAARTLESAHLLLHFEGAADEDDGNVGNEFLEFGKIIETVFASVENVVEHDEVGLFLGDGGKGIAAGGDAFEVVFFGKGVFVDFILQVVILDYEKQRSVHAVLVRED